jgi:hypothetical protein
LKIPVYDDSIEGYNRYRITRFTAPIFFTETFKTENKIPTGLYDVPVIRQITFQDPATYRIELIISLHHNIIFFLI